MAKKRLILFDIDGTLCDSTQLDDESYFEAFEEVFDLDIRKKDWSELKHVTDWGLTEELVYEAFQRYPNQEEYHALENTFLKKLQHQIVSKKIQLTEIPGAVRFFNHLKAQPHTAVGLATGGWESSARLKLDEIGVVYEKLPFGHSNLHKSREAIMQHTLEEAMEMYDVNFEQTIYIGDGVWDYYACKNLDMPFMGIDYHGTKRLSALGTKTVIKDFTDLDLVLKKLELIFTQ